MIRIRMSSTQSNIMLRLTILFIFLMAFGGKPLPAIGATNRPQTGPRVLILHHGGSTNFPSRLSPDAITHATTPAVNVEKLARSLEAELIGQGCRVVRVTPDSIRSFRDFLEYDAILIGSPVWFSNMSWPIKKLFDTHFFQLYEHHPGRLHGTVMSAFCTVMESGSSGPRALQAIMGGLEHLTDRTVPGLVIQTGMSETEWRPLLRSFAERILGAIPKNNEN